MKHPYQKVTDGTVCNWEINPAGTMKDLRDAVKIINRIGDKIGGECPICTGGLNKWGHTQACYDLQAWANRPSIKALEVKG